MRNRILALIAAATLAIPLAACKAAPPEQDKIDPYDACWAIPSAPQAVDVYVIGWADVQCSRDAHDLSVLVTLRQDLSDAWTIQGSETFTRGELLRDSEEGWRTGEVRAPCRKDRWQVTARLTYWRGKERYIVTRQSSKKPLTCKREIRFMTG